MNCTNHPDLPAVAYCRTCGVPLCENCRRAEGGIIYCAHHQPVPAPAAAPPPAEPHPPAQPAADTSSPYNAPYATPAQPTASHQAGASPGLAFLLGWIPGVGAIYNGQYVKGILHVVVLGILIGIVSSDQASGGLQPLFGMMIAAWFAYMAFEAYHTAKKRQLGYPVDEFSSILPRRGPSSFPVAPIVMIALGLLFLLNNLDILHFVQLLRYWPIALIGLGVYMLYQRLPRSTHSTSSSSITEATHERQ